LYILYIDTWLDFAAAQRFVLVPSKQYYVSAILDFCSDMDRLCFCATIPTRHNLARLSRWKRADADARCCTVSAVGLGLGLELLVEAWLRSPSHPSTGDVRLDDKQLLHYGTWNLHQLRTWIRSLHLPSTIPSIRLPLRAERRAIGLVQAHTSPPSQLRSCNHTQCNAPTTSGIAVARL
jgi:hypothetical protein